MDIVADSLSAGLLKTKNVTVRGKDIIEWFESKLSAAVSFIGVFERLEDAPKKNGAVAIVGSKDYIYSEDAGEWQEFGDEGQIGAISQAVEAISCGLSDYVLSNDLSDYVLSNNLSNYYQKSETSSATQLLNALSGLQPAGNYLSVETDPVFQTLSGSFLTAHQSLSGYYQKSEASSSTQLEEEFSNYYRTNETSSSKEISTALCAVLSAKDFSTVLSGKTYNYDDSITWMASAIIDIVSAMGGTVITQ